MVYNVENTERANKVAQRLKEESEVVKYGNNNLEKYVADYIVEAMLQWKESNHLLLNLKEKSLIALYDYDSNKNLLKNIIEFMYENEEKQYPLLLDFGFAYDMVIDYADYMACIDSEKVTVKCLNCGEEYTTFRKYVNEDDKGTYVTCKCCGATCDIDL